MDDGIGPPPPPPADLLIPTEEELVKQYGSGSKGKKRKHEEQSRTTGTVVPEWQPDGSDPTPWCTVDHSRTADTGLR
jgi:non-canonical poly(A) RNA polymerase PAPD5/7